MATTFTNSPQALDFGATAYGVLSSGQTITLTATGGTVSVTSLTMSNSDFSLISAPSLPYNVLVGTPLVLTVKLTPSVYGIESGTLTIGSNAGTLIVPVVGIGGSNYVQYSLPSILNRPCGQINCYLFLDSQFATLMMPTAVKFLDIGAIVENVDAEAGTIDIENIDIALAEDYTTYSEGFWYKLIVENPTLNIDFMFTIINGSNEEFLYRGTVYRQGGEVPEYYLDNVSSPGSWVRGMKIQLVSSLLNMKSVTIADLCTAVQARFTSKVNKTVYAGATSYNFATVKTVIAAMMEMTFAGAYDESLIVDNGDFSISAPTMPSPSYVSWLEGWILYSWFYENGVQNGVDIGYPVYGGWATTTQPFTYFSNMGSAWDLLVNFCMEFGVCPRYTFGNSSGLIDSTPSNNKHRITFNTRGKSGTVITPVGNVISSSINADTSRKAKRLRATLNFGSPPAQSFFFDGAMYGDITAQTWMQFDKEVAVDFDGFPDLPALSDRSGATVGNWIGGGNQSVTADADAPDDIGGTPFGQALHFHSSSSGDFSSNYCQLPIADCPKWVVGQEYTITFDADGAACSDDSWPVLNIFIGGVVVASFSVEMATAGFSFNFTPTVAVEKIAVYLENGGTGGDVWVKNIVILQTGDVGVQTYPYPFIYQDDGSGNVYAATDFKYWNYSTAATEIADNLPKAIALYYFERFGSLLNRMEYSRTYTSLQANNGSSNSQMWMQNLNRTTINDGITIRNFYATEIHKDILKNQATVVWVEE